MNNSLFSDDLKFTLLDQSEIVSESILFMGSSFYRELFIFAHSLFIHQPVEIVSLTHLRGCVNIRLE